MGESIKKGDKVKVTVNSATSGYANDQENVKKYLNIGEEYTVKEVVVKNWTTDVYLQEVAGRFNSVNFVNV